MALPAGGVFLIVQRALYSLLLRMALPAQVARYWWRGWRNSAYRGSVRIHLAVGLGARADRPLWLHAASVGEAQALSPLVDQLRATRPELPLLLTVGTPTGLAHARARFASHLDGGTSALTLLAAPWDLPGAARRFISTQRPGAAVFVEGELWPNLLHEAARAGIPLLLASARVSARSTRRYRRWAASLIRGTVRAFTRIGAQSPADRERFIALGADPRAVECWGNLKFDFTPPPGITQQGRQLRSRLAAARPMWVAGSTHAGEEEACLAAQQSLQQAARARGAAAPLLVIAPRRPERFDEVARLVTDRGFALQRHLPTPGRDVADVLLVDRMGELLPYYAAADAVFVGGSLVPVGGHNLLEPAALGKPVLAGPHTGNAPDVAQRLEAAGGLLRIGDASGLAQALAALLQDPALARRTGEAAARAVATHAGATARVLEAITAVLPAWPAASDGFPEPPSAGG